MIDIICANFLNRPIRDFDVLITDPPYREHVHKAATSCSSKRVNGKQQMGASFRDLGFSHRLPEIMFGICDLAARAKRWSVIFSDLESIGDWMITLQQAGAEYIRTVPWIRWSMPQLSGDRPPQGAEAIIIAHAKRKGKKSWNGPGNLTHFDEACLRGEWKHKAEKPLDLMLRLVSYFSDAGEIVLDPMLGSGTTALACQVLHRNCLGIELDPKWASRANSRLFPATLSARDSQRLRRFQVRMQEERVDLARIAYATQSVRSLSHHVALK